MACRSDRHEFGVGRPAIHSEWPSQISGRVGLRARNRRPEIAPISSIRHMEMCAWHILIRR